MREKLKKDSKPKKKGAEELKFKKAIIIYRSKFQEYQQVVLKLLRECIVDQKIRP